MTFSTIRGHARTLRLIARAIAADSLPPSLVFAGPEGVGKRQAATAVAQVLNCLRPVRAVTGSDLPVDACGECASCLRIARGVHPDVITLRPEDGKAWVSIDQVRALNEQVAYRPFEARRRVVILDDAPDVLLGMAQNALLKTLEEPPSGTVFILIAAQLEGLLPTVRSRCPLVRFGALSVPDVAAYLEEDAGFDAADARARAAVSDGSIGVALAADDLADAREGAQRVLQQLSRAADPRSRLDAARHIVGKAGKSRAAGERDALALHLRLLHGLLRDVGLLSTRADTRALAHADLQPALAELVPAFQGARLDGAFTAIDRALGALDRNASPKIVADWLVLQL
jgi:DNA polymerase-3 subunit delta'